MSLNRERTIQRLMPVFVTTTLYVQNESARLVYMNVKDAYKQLGIELGYHTPSICRSWDRYTIWSVDSKGVCACVVIAEDGHIESILPDDIDTYAQEHGFVMPNYPDTNIIAKRTALVDDIIPAYLDDDEYHTACELGSAVFKTGKLVYQRLECTPGEYGGELHQIYQFADCYVYIDNLYGSCPGCFKESNVLLHRVESSYVSGKYADILNYISKS